eukprot:TRINITY_DN9569_c0_g1_i1.p1 TRINITY_DN9569_c0_g1~~TRINITY_DN9569_c0_g1_i1.p1  ORF type:complete len:143 (-),score=33.84 TRINITY_DN9569_c0_g1_i1:95-523(-)
MAYSFPGSQEPFRLPGTVSLVEDLDKKVLVILRDGRKLYGFFRTFDQYANIVLEDTVERMFFSDMYCEVLLGTFIIRGENVVLIGEVDLYKEHSLSSLKRVTPEEILRLEAEKASVLEEQTKQLRKTTGFRGPSAEPGDDHF